MYLARQTEDLGIDSILVIFHTRFVAKLYFAVNLLANIKMALQPIDLTEHIQIEVFWQTSYITRLGEE